MSQSERLDKLRNKVTGKWQIPLFVVGFGALAGSLLFYKPPSERIPFDEWRAELDTFISSGQYTLAIEQAGRLLGVPDRREEERSPVYAALARANMLRAKESAFGQPAVGEAVIAEYLKAAEGGYSLGSTDHELVGLAYEWQDDFRSAVRHYDASVALAADGGSLELRWRLARIRIERLGMDSSDLESALDELIEQSGGRLDVLVWAIRQKVPALCEADRVEEAEALLESVGDRVGDEVEGLWIEYLRAFVDLARGLRSEAESRLRALRGKLVLKDELYAASGWLLGRVVLGGDDPERPMEALTFFKDALSFVGESPYAAASSLGMGEALVLLERYDEGLGRYEEAIEGLRRFSERRMFDAALIESSLMVAAERLRGKGAIEAALSFAETALTVQEGGDVARRVKILERTAGLRAAVGRSKRVASERLREGRRKAGFEAGEDSVGSGVVDESSSDMAAFEREAREMLLSAAQAHETIAGLLTHENRRSAEAFWVAATLTQESGDAEATVEMMSGFERRHPTNEMVPRALKFMGRAYQELGRFADAVETYQENFRRFPRTPDASGSLIPLAECYIDMGKQHAEMAEKTLRLVLDSSEVFTPEAPEYADAMFLLGDLLNRTGAFERAIPVLEEVLFRFPVDERTSRARFLLGDCYRQSGLGLEEAFASASFAGERQQLSARRVERLRKAAVLFERMVDEFEQRGEFELSPLDRVYLKHARLYQADCYFELGEFGEALRLYERAAWVYKGSTTALACYVQTINCQVFMGHMEEAKAALRRAQYLVEALPVEAFGTTVEPETSNDWRSYFAWVEETALFN